MTTKKQPKWKATTNDNRPYCYVRNDVLNFSAETGRWEMPCNSIGTRFATIREALDALRAVFGTQVSISHEDDFESRYGTRSHWLAGIDGTTLPAIIEYPACEYTCDLTSDSAPTYRLAI